MKSILELTNELQKLINEKPENYLGRKLDVKCVCGKDFTLERIQSKYGRGVSQELADKVLKN